MRHDAGVHQRGGGIAIFVAEIGADQLLPFVADAVELEIEQRADLGEAFEENLARLPVALLEILHHDLELPPDLAIVEGQHGIDQPVGAPGFGRTALPCEMEWPDDDPRRIGLEPERVQT